MVSTPTPPPVATRWIWRRPIGTSTSHLFDGVASGAHGWVAACGHDLRPGRDGTRAEDHTAPHWGRARAMCGSCRIATQDFDEQI